MKKHGFILIIVLLVLSACGNVSSNIEDKEISLIVFDNPAYVDVTEIAKEEVEKQGYTLNVTYLNDIIQPNQAVNEKEAFGNWFQHKAYLEQFNKDYKTDLAPTFDLYIDVAGLYSTKHDSIDDIQKGAIVAIPIDPSNNGRALFMLQDQGLLKLKDGISVIKASPKDIIENPLQLKFKEVDQLMLSRTIDDVDLAFAFASTISTGQLDRAYELAVEKDDERIHPYLETIAVHKDNVDSEKVEVLKKAFQNDRVEEVFAKNFPNIILGW